MAIERANGPAEKFCAAGLPWLLAAAAFVVYGLTLNRWVSLFNLPAVAETVRLDLAAGSLQARFLSGHLPVPLAAGGADSLALNLFSAVCAALTLGLLARSVAMLPHDRTDAQRRREQQRFFISDHRQRVAAAGVRRAGLRLANDVLGTRDQLHGRNVRPAAVRVRDLVAAGIPAG